MGNYETVVKKEDGYFETHCICVTQIDLEHFCSRIPSQNTYGFVPQIATINPKDPQRLTI